MAWSTDSNRYRGVNPKTAARIRRRDGNRCQACGQPGHEVDHIINVKAGGTDRPDNLETLCTPCHKAKTQREAQKALQDRREALRLPAEPHPLTLHAHKGGGCLPSPPGERRDA